MALTITIASERPFSVEGRLVAGETASVTVTGGTPAALYVCDADREVVASCESFSDGVGSINMATEQIAALVAEIPAGRMFCLAAQLQDSSGAVIGYGFLPVVSAPMPDELEDVSVDAYVKAPQLAAAFDASQSYAVGDLVTYGGLLYKCVTAHPAGAWDADDFTETTVAQAIAEGGGSSVTVDDTLTASSTNPVKSSGIWAHIWGALTAIPDGAASVYAWVTAQLAGKAPVTEPVFTAWKERTSIAAGSGATSTGISSIAFGDSAAASGDSSVAIGDAAVAGENGAVAIGAGAQATTFNAVQLGTGTNSTASSLQFLDYPLVDADGYIPNARLNADVMRYPFEAATATSVDITIGESTVSALSITVADRTVTSYTPANGAALRPLIGAGESGYARDCILVLDCSNYTAGATITMQFAGALTGDTIHAFDGDDDNLAAEAGKVNIYLVTEVEAGKLVVARHILAEAAS